MAQTHDEAFSATASAHTQAVLLRLLARMDALIDVRDASVRRAMADYAAEGVASEYTSVEARWRSASLELRRTIASLRSTLTQADGTADDALARARAVVGSLSAS